MTTRVVHVNSPEFRDNPEAVYIGRKSFRAKDKRCRRQSPWHNPFILDEDGDRDTIIGLFETRMRERLRGGGSSGWTKALLSLDGKVLGCWCHPKPCHGDVICKLISELKSERPRDGK